MNDHEIDRIAAAMNMLRPDWPKQQLRTLLNDERITTRPRRDVCVALSWIAAEPASHNPYRVLESGPWWRAAGVEGSVTPGPEKIAADQRCSICSMRQDAYLHPSDHEFSRPTEKLDPEAVAAKVAALKADLEPTAGPTQRRTLADMAEANPELHAKVEAVRAANPGVRADPDLLREPEPPTEPEETETVASTSEQEA
jgi:hypothetical protein